jgi:hypothetical protein
MLSFMTTIIKEHLKYDLVMDVIMDWGLALCLMFVTTLESQINWIKSFQIDLIFWVSFHIMKIGLGSSLGFM